MTKPCAIPPGGVVLSLMLGWSFWTAKVAAQQAVPEIRFDGNVDFLKLPTNVYLGEVAGVAVNSKRHVFVFTRTGERSTVHGASASQLFEFGPDGQLIREIGRSEEHTSEL